MGDIVHITHADDPRVDEYRRLGDHAERARLEGDEFFISEGWVSIERLIDSGHRIRSALLSPSRVARFEPFMQQPAVADAPVYVAERDVMSDIAGFDLPRGVHVAADRKPMRTIAELATTAHRLVVLDRLEDDESVGAIARAARAFGIDAMILGPTCTDPYHRRIVRVSMGEILHLPIARASHDEWADVLEVLRSYGVDSWAITTDEIDHPTDADGSIWTFDVPKRLSLVFGPQDGAPAVDLLETATRRVQLPTASGTASIPVAHMAAIACAAVSRNGRR